MKGGGSTRQNPNSTMGKKQKKGGMTMDALQGSTLREQNTGKKHVDVNTMLSLEYLQRIATWAAGEGVVPPLAALYGRQLASTAEAAGVPVDSSIFLCERCETILLPGSNCNVRIETNKKKKKKARCGKIPSQNSVVYYCKFCSHPNVMRGTPRGYVKELIASKITASVSDVKPQSSLDEEIARVNAVDKAKAVEESPKTPLLNSSKKKKKMNASTLNKPTESISGTIHSIESTSGTSKQKRKRKGWLSLKEIAIRNEAENIQTINSLVIPFDLQSPTNNQSFK